jgi:hypothetical protein
MSTSVTAVEAEDFKEAKAKVKNLKGFPSSTVYQDTDDTLSVNMPPSDMGLYCTAIIEDKPLKFIKENRQEKCLICKKDILFDDFGVINGLEGEVSAGYGSSYDGNIFKIILCDDCIVQFAPPIKGSFL